MSRSRKTSVVLRRARRVVCVEAENAIVDDDAKLMVRGGFGGYRVMYTYSGSVVLLLKRHQ